MGTFLKNLLAGVGVSCGLYSAAGEGLLYVISNVNGDPSFAIPKRKNSDKESVINSVRLEDREWLLESGLEDYYIRSSEGLRLHATYLEADEESDLFVVLVNGYHVLTPDSYDSIARFYHDNGFNVLMTDLRGHGQSEGKYITFGNKESDDLMRWIAALRTLFGKYIKIALHGVSMGASIVAMALGKVLPDNVTFAVCDCGYTDLQSQLIHMFDRTILPSKLCYKIFRSAAINRAHFDPDEVRPIDCIKDCEIPVLFVHGEDDAMIKCDSVYELYDACEVDDKYLVTVPGAEHARSFYYDNTVMTAILDMMDEFM